MKATLISVLKYIILLVVGVTLLWFAFKGQDLQRLTSDLKHANYAWIVSSIIISLIAHYIRAVRWNMLIKPLGYEPKSRVTFYAVMIGYLANLAFPRMGEISRCGVLTRVEKAPLHKLIGTVITERIIDLLFLLIILLSAIIIEFKTISNFLYVNLFVGLINKFEKNTSFLISFLVIVVVGLGLTFFLYKKYKEQIFAFRGVVKFINLLKGIREGVASVGKMEQKGRFIFYSISIWVCYYLASYFCFFSLSSTANLSAFVALFILAIGGLGMSAPVQGGIGAYHWIVSQGLTLFGITQSDGLVYATINHSSQIISILVVGSLCLIALFFLKSNMKHKK